MQNRQYNVQQNSKGMIARGSATAPISASATKVLRNTYTLLAMTLIFSAVMAAVSMSIGLSRGASLVCSLGALALVWLVLPRTANSSAGIGVVFAFTGLLGLSRCITCSSPTAGRSSCKLWVELAWCFSPCQATC